MDKRYKVSIRKKKKIPLFYYTKSKITLNAVWKLKVMDISETQTWKCTWCIFKISDDDFNSRKTLNAFPPKVSLCFSYSHAAACQIESSKGEGTAEPRFSQQAVWRYDKAGPAHSEELPSKTKHKQMSAADSVLFQQCSLHSWLSHKCTSVLLFWGVVEFYPTIIR